MVFCCGGVFLSVMLNNLEWIWVPSNLPMRTKSQGIEVIQSTFNHPTLNWNNTTTHQVLNSKFKTQTKTKLSYVPFIITYTFYYNTHSQLHMRPTINLLYQTYYICTLSVALYSIVHFPFKVQKHPFIYITEHHKTKVSFLS